MIEAPLDRAFSVPRIRELCRDPVEIFLFASPEAVFDRHRLRLPRQHACHLPHPLPTLDQVHEGLAATKPLRLGGPLLELDVTQPCDVDKVVGWARQFV
jgi:hypothetical protein